MDPFPIMLKRLDIHYLCKMLKKKCSGYCSGLRLLNNIID